MAGPLADRIDIQIDLSMPESTAFLSARKGTSSEALREGVMRAHEFATWRAERESAVSDSMETLILRSTSDEAHRFMENAATAAHMDGRSIVSAMKVARTIADMDESPEIGVNHVAEALALRPHLANGDA